MPVTRMSASHDSTSDRLVKITHAMMLASPRTLPDVAAKDSWSLARAARSALLAGEQEVAALLVEEIMSTLDGIESDYVIAVRKRALDLHRALTWRPTSG